MTPSGGGADVVTTSYYGIVAVPGANLTAGGSSDLRCPVPYSAFPMYISDIDLQTELFIGGYLSGFEDTSDVIEGTMPTLYVADLDAANKELKWNESSPFAHPLQYDSTTESVHNAYAANNAVVAQNDNSRCSLEIYADLPAGGDWTIGSTEWSSSPKRRYWLSYRTYGTFGRIRSP